ncbi:MAG: cytochrome c biogenesis CcdA family protein [Eubacteriales bacterium]|nr:cytochrome c biogenesis CcdA family protein [Eubacteriales bacterium]
MTPLFTAAPQAVSLWAMLGAGLLAFVSPCVLPMLPVYTVYLMSGTEDTKKASPFAVFLRCAGLLLGFVLLYTIIGAGAGLLGSALKNMNRAAMNILSGSLMILFGLWLFDVFHISTSHGSSFLSKINCQMNGFWGSFLFGLVMALSFTSCLTPVLANALILAASADGATMWTGIASLAVFALGLCLPMLAVMLLYQWLKGALQWLRAHQMLIRRLGGGLMILYGLYMIITSL